MPGALKSLALILSHFASFLPPHPHPLPCWGTLSSAEKSTPIVSFTHDWHLTVRSSEPTSTISVASSKPWPQRCPDVLMRKWLLLPLNSCHLQRTGHQALHHQPRSIIISTVPVIMATAMFSHPARPPIAVAIVSVPPVPLLPVLGPLPPLSWHRWQLFYHLSLIALMASPVCSAPNREEPDCLQHLMVDSGIRLRF